MAEMATVKNVSKKRKFVADGVFFAELNQLFHRELDEFGFSGVEVRRGQTKTEIIIRAAKAQDVLGEKGRRIRELTRIVQNRFKFDDGQVELYAERIDVRGLCAQTQAESLRVKLLAMLPARRASYAILKFVMESGAKGCQIVISGKLRGQRAKAAKFRDGYMVKSGQTSRDYVDTAIRHVLMRQGMLGVKVQIMLPHDPTGKSGPKKLMGDQVIIKDPKE